MDNIEEILTQENKKNHSNELQKISDVFDSFYDMKTIIEQIENYLITKSNFPIPTFTFNNKLVELNREFKNHNLHLYKKYRYLPDGTFALTPGISDSFLGISILTDLTNYINICADTIETYYNTIFHLYKLKNNKIIKFLTSFSNKGVEEIILSHDKYYLLYYIQKYKKYDDKIYNYNLKDNVVDSIIKAVKHYDLDACALSIIIEDDIVPDLNKLGLSDQIPILKNKLIEEYKKELPNDYKVPANEMFLYVPDFDKVKKLRNEIISNPDMTIELFYNLLYNVDKKSQSKVRKK